VRALGVTGPAEVILRRRADGQEAVLSVHPRFGRQCAELLDVLADSRVLPRRRRAGEPGPGLER
jgi:carbamoyl-phosphate synthase large subunit